jgi:DNA-binding NarL/FixJ family response regulator
MDAYPEYVLYSCLGMISKSSRKSRVSVFVLAAHPMVVAQVQRILGVTATPIDAAQLEVVTSEVRSNPPRSSVYIVDAASSEKGAIAEVRDLLLHEPGAHVIVLGDHFEEREAFELLNLGVKGLVTHEKMAEQLPRALQIVSSGGLWVWRNVLSRFVDFLVCGSRQEPVQPPGDVRISQRERQIATALLKNLTNKEIASELNISERTVKFHVSNLLSKFKVQRRSELVLLWYERNLPGLDPRLIN